MRAAIVFSALLAVIVAVPARASEGPEPEAFATRLLGKVPAGQKVRACFTRVYPADHLAKHPKQKVSEMMLMVSGDLDPETKQPTYGFSLGLKFRARKDRLESFGFCNHAKMSETDPAGLAATLDCGVDCDGGGLTLTIAPDNASVLVVPAEHLRLWKPGTDDESSGDSLRPGQDDKSFRLERAALTDCLPIAADKDEAALMKRDR